MKYYPANDLIRICFGIVAIVNAQLMHLRKETRTIQYKELKEVRGIDSEYAGCQCAAMCLSTHGIRGLNLK